MVNGEFSKSPATFYYLIMNEIATTMNTLSALLTSRSLNHLTLIVDAMLAMTGRVSMLNMSRWTEKGGSYRTIQRFFSEKIDWAALRWQLINHHLATEKSVWLLAGDEVVVTKSGKETHGIGTFYSSIYKKPLPSLCFTALSLICVETRKAYPLIVKQLVRSDVQDSAPKAVKPKSEKPGRPKGSTNKNKKEVTFSPFQQLLQGCIREALKLIGTNLSIVYFVYDGALGNNASLQAVKQSGLSLISKLRHDSSLYFPHAGTYSGKGRKCKYGDKLTPETLTSAYLIKETVEDGMRTCIYQAKVWHKNFGYHFKTGQPAISMG